jgi:hypothetical protein
MGFVAIVSVFQRKWKWEIVQSLRREKKTFETQIRLQEIAFGYECPVSQPGLPLHGRTSVKRFQRESARSAEKSATMSEAKLAGAGGTATEGSGVKSRPFSAKSLCIPSTATQKED